MATVLADSIVAEWGHLLITPDGRKIRVPAAVFPALRQIGCLIGDRRLSPLVHKFMEPEYDALAVGLRLLLGRDLSGPAWLVCNCQECKERGCDNVRMPKQPAPGYEDADRVVADVKARRPA